jgi:hypothetical protein
MQVRREVTSNMKRDVILETALDRRMYRRSRTVAIRNSYITDQLEAAQREALEKRRAAKHQNYMNTIMQHRQRFIDFHAKVREPGRLLQHAGAALTVGLHYRAGGNGAAQRCGARAAGASAAGGV